jgi:hypothetical protein
MRSKSPSSYHSGSYCGRTALVIAASITLASIALSGCATTNYQDRTFFRDEYGLDTHGRKTWFDHLVELDPGALKTYVADNYQQVAPAKIAVLPFTDHGSAQYVVDKVALTHRNAEQQADWAWTDSNRMRRAVNGYLASREFLEANLIQVDAVLREHQIDSEEKLDKVPPQTLGKWLGVDAVVYGDVTHYESYYALLISAWQVGVGVKMVSTHDGEELFSATGSRYSVNFMPAFDPLDIAINSGLSLLELRDVTLARAEEEDAREIALRIPRSDKLKSQLIEETRNSESEPIIDAGDMLQIPSNLNDVALF